MNPVNFSWLRYLAAVVLCVSPLLAVSSDRQVASASEGIDWELTRQRMSMLSQMGFHPFLMPLIMENRDAIGLENDQIKTFREWRSKNRVPLIHTMNEIIRARAEFQRIALNPKTREEVLYAKQEEIFRLHRKVLKYQLSCRRSILDTFSAEQWDNFRFILTENGYVLDE